MEMEIIIIQGLGLSLKENMPTSSNERKLIFHARCEVGFDSVECI